jgi:hypothetical protein
MLPIFIASQAGQCTDCTLLSQESHFTDPTLHRLHNPSLSEGCPHLGQNRSVIAIFLQPEDLCVWHVSDHDAGGAGDDAHIDCERNCLLTHDIGIVRLTERLTDLVSRCLTVPIERFRDANLDLSIRNSGIDQLAVAERNDGHAIWAPVDLQKH